MPDQMPMAPSEEIGTETGEVVSPRTAARTELGQIGGFVSFRGDDSRLDFFFFLTWLNLEKISIHDQ